MFETEYSVKIVQHHQQGFKTRNTFDDCVLTFHDVFQSLSN
jgi:hypothetical protein